LFLFRLFKFLIFLLILKPCPHFLSVSYKYILPYLYGICSGTPGITAICSFRFPISGVSLAHTAPLEQVALMRFLTHNQTSVMAILCDLALSRQISLDGVRCRCRLGQVQWTRDRRLRNQGPEKPHFVHPPFRTHRPHPPAVEPTVELTI